MAKKLFNQKEGGGGNFFFEKRLFSHLAEEEEKLIPWGPTLQRFNLGFWIPLLLILPPSELFCFRFLMSPPRLEVERAKPELVWVEPRQAWAFKSQAQTSRSPRKGSLSLIPARAFHLKKQHSSSSSLLWAFPKIRHIKLRACGLFIASLKFGPGPRTRALARSTSNLVRLVRAQDQLLHNSIKADSLSEPRRKKKKRKEDFFPKS